MIECVSKINVDLVKRMYQDHGYDLDEICLRLRYPPEIVEELIRKYNLINGEKSWRY
jgi:hypothetical protein